MVTAYPATAPMHISISAIEIFRRFARIVEIIARVNHRVAMVNISSIESSQKTKPAGRRIHFSANPTA